MIKLVSRHNTFANLVRDFGEESLFPLSVVRTTSLGVLLTEDEETIPK
jgi:hypothetical protein